MYRPGLLRDRRAGHGARGRARHRRLARASSSPTPGSRAGSTRSSRPAHGLSLAEYDALLQIAHAPGRRVRMNVLAERVILSRSGITRLVDRLEARRLGRADRLLDRRPRPGGGPHAGRPRPAADARRRPTSTASGATSSTRSTAADLDALEASLGRVAGAARAGEPPDPRGLPAGRGLTRAVGRAGSGRGTSGFAYPAWSPRFYPPGLRGTGCCATTASRLATVELNNTFYRQPSPAAVDGWLAATPAGLPVRGQGPARRRRSGRSRSIPARACRG